jgi:hypothetical protein
VCVKFCKKVDLVMWSVHGEDRHHHFMSKPQPSRDIDPEFVALQRTITECGARILYRGTEIASYNEPKALAQRG